MNPSIVLFTSSSFKASEFKQHFAQYNVSLSVVSPTETPKGHPTLEMDGCLGYITEEGSLLDVDWGKWLQHPIPCAARFRSRLTFVRTGRLLSTIREYVAIIPGHLFPSSNLIYQEDESITNEQKDDHYIALNRGFGWSNMFRPVCWQDQSQPRNSAPSYRLSPQQMVCRALIQELRIEYESGFNDWKRLDTKWMTENNRNNISKLTRTVDLSIDAYLSLSGLFVEEQSVSHWFEPVRKRVVNDGLFFRGTSGKEQRTPWAIGWNTGIPISSYISNRGDVNMSESIHLIHDLCRQVVVDPLILASPTLQTTTTQTQTHLLTTKEENSLYVLIRLMAETISLAMSETLFPDCAALDGIKGKSNIRSWCRMHYRQVGIHTMTELKDMCRYWFHTAILRQGDSLSSYDSETAKEFHELYVRRAIADVGHSQQTSAFMRQYNSAYQSWYTKYAPLLKQLGVRSVTDLWQDIVSIYGSVARSESTALFSPLGIPTVYSQKMKYDTLEAIFEWVYWRYSSLYFTNSDVSLKEGEIASSYGYGRDACTSFLLIPAIRRQQRAFQRWGISQMLFFEFQGQRLPSASFWENQLKCALLASEIETFRALYDLMLQEAVVHQVISADDAKVFVEIYSPTPPCLPPGSATTASGVGGGSGGGTVNNVLSLGGVAGRGGNSGAQKGGVSVNWFYDNLQQICSGLPTIIPATTTRG